MARTTSFSCRPASAALLPSLIFSIKILPSISGLTEAKVVSLAGLALQLDAQLSLLCT